MLLLHQCREKRSLELVARQPDRGFNPLLICLSHPAFWKMVPRRDDAPRSPAYRAGALLLSYGGMGSVVQPSRLSLKKQSRGLHHTLELAPRVGGAPTRPL